MIITSQCSGLALQFFITDLCAGIARTTGTAGTAGTIVEEEEEEEELAEAEEHRISLHSERTWELDKVDLV